MFLFYLFEVLRPTREFDICLLYTSDAADDMQCVDLGGRRIIKKEVECRGVDAVRGGGSVFSSRRRHTRCREVSWARRCV